MADPVRDALEAEYPDGPWPPQTPYHRPEMLDTGRLAVNPMRALSGLDAARNTFGSEGIAKGEENWLGRLLQSPYVKPVADYLNWATPGGRAMFIGTKAKLSPKQLKALDEAQRLEMTQNPETVWRNTMWERDPFSNQWRTEISDRKSHWKDLGASVEKETDKLWRQLRMKYPNQTITEWEMKHWDDPLVQRHAHLGDDQKARLTGIVNEVPIDRLPAYLHHPELYKQLEDARHIRAGEGELGHGTMGSMSLAGDGTLMVARDWDSFTGQKLRGNLPMDLRFAAPEDIKRWVALHEAQHWASAQHGWPHGSNPETAQRHPEMERVMKARHDRIKAVHDAASRAHEINPTQRTYEDLAWSKKALDEFNWTPSTEDILKLYERDRGEVDARNTQARRDWDENMRREMPPRKSEDVPLDQQLVLDDAFKDPD